MKSLIECVFSRDVELLRTLLSHGENVNQQDRDGRTPLIHAAIDNKLECAMVLLELDADANVQDAFGNAALHYAAQNYHCQMASLLIEHGAVIDVEDIHGNTPLWRAVFNSQGRGEMIGILLGAGANRNHRNHHNKTPLDLAHTIANYNVARFFYGNVDGR